jgi:hypothetical protein
MAIDIQRSINIDNCPQVACSGIIPERVSSHHVGSGRKLTSARQTARTSEIGDCSMDRSNAVACLGSTMRVEDSHRLQGS